MNMENDWGSMEGFHTAAVFVRNEILMKQITNIETNIE